VAVEETQDPRVVIEERREGYVRYRNTETRQRWEVHGECIGLGHCIVGATLPDGEVVETLERAREVWAEGRERFPLDSPVGPGFKGCCPLRVVEL
jgi:hypothetical protein